VSTASADIVERTPAERDAFDGILALLCERTGTDFGCYRPSTVTRRVLNRMISVGASSFSDYLALLRDNEAETAHLLQRVTIKVSRFYRNREVFDVLRERVIPGLARARAGEPLRIWSAGCGYGEEPYTLAMLLEDGGVPGRISATDIDRTALNAALAARYTDAALGELPNDLRERYLYSIHGTQVVCDTVRDRVQFAYGDLTALAAGTIREFDLICCRNVLIYLAHDVQHRILSSLIGHVRPGGYLCLGEAEWPASPLAARLEPLGHKTRIFHVLGAPGAQSIGLGGKAW
jgi:chemotaxis methyl-accepting protein methylase